MQYWGHLEMTWMFFITYAGFISQLTDYHKVKMCEYRGISFPLYLKKKKRNIIMRRRCENFYSFYFFYSLRPEEILNSISSDKN